MSHILNHTKHLIYFCCRLLHRRFLRWTKPPPTSLLLGSIRDLTRGKAELVAENALLRQQLIILRRQIKRPICTKTDRLLLVLLAKAVRAWRQALLIVQPETLLKWYRQGFRLFWKQKSKAKSAKAKVKAQTIALINEIASNNRLWGAERIRGELLKLDIRVCKRTIQKYMRYVRTPRSRGQNWATFLRNHAGEIWACDFFQVTDLFIRSLFAFFIIELKSRKVIHVGVTRSPTDAWTAQQLREATPYGQAPRYLIRDNDGKFGPCCARVAATSGINIRKTPYHAKRPNAICERFLLSVRRECLDHVLILHEKQLHRVLRAYRNYGLESPRLLKRGMKSRSLFGAWGMGRPCALLGYPWRCRSRYRWMVSPLTLPAVERKKERDYSAGRVRKRAGALSLVFSSAGLPLNSFHLLLAQKECSSNTSARKGRAWC